MRENASTPEGRQLGFHLARLCDGEASKSGRDGRCGTCAFRAGVHIANGSPETLMTALKCVMEREPFWCHEADKPCSGWILMRAQTDGLITMPWNYVEGADDSAPAQHMPGMNRDG